MFKVDCFLTDTDVSGAMDITHQLQKCFQKLKVFQLTPLV